MPDIDRIRFTRQLSTLVAAFAFAAALPAQDVTVAVADSLPAMSRAALGAARADASERRFASFGAFADDLRRVYGDGDLELLWTRAGTPTSAARAAVASLQRLGERGLDPAAFDVSRITALAASSLRSEDERFEFDALLSMASLRTLRALHGVRDGKDDGVRGSGDGKTGSADHRGIGGRPRALPDSARAAAALATAPGAFTTTLRALAASTRADSIFDAAEPASAQYQLLKASLGTYRTLASRDPVAQGQLERIVATLDRARTHRDDDLTAGVVVNIPEFRLHAAGGRGAADTLAMNVVVGVAGLHRTPEMRDSIRYLVFAPYWEVPASIVRSELLPIGRRDPRLLTLNNFQILDRRGRVLPATAKSVKLVAAGRARIRQLPGGTNSLGRVKFMFPNSEDIYLHDTPTRKDFARYRRDQSHGCVRVGDPGALARFLLSDQPEWTAERIEAAMNGSAPVTVKLTKAIPIRLTYETAVARADGSIDFFDDVYGLDTSARP